MRIPKLTTNSSEVGSHAARKPAIDTILFIGKPQQTIPLLLSGAIVQFKELQGGQTLATLGTHHFPEILESPGLHPPVETDAEQTAYIVYEM